jgi:hypothetical protein
MVHKELFSNIKFVLCQNNPKMNYICNYLVIEAFIIFYGESDEF